MAYRTDAACLSYLDSMSVSIGTCVKTFVDCLHQDLDLSVPHLSIRTYLTMHVGHLEMPPPREAPRRVRRDQEQSGSRRDIRLVGGWLALTACSSGGCVTGLVSARYLARLIFGKDWSSSLSCQGCDAVRWAGAPLNLRRVFYIDVTAGILTAR